MIRYIDKEQKIWKWQHDVQILQGKQIKNWGQKLTKN